MNCYTECDRYFCLYSLCNGEIYQNEPDQLALLVELGPTCVPEYITLFCECAHKLFYECVPQTVLQK